MKNANHNRSQDAVIRRAVQARSAAEKYADEIDLRQNHAAAIATDLYHLIGHPIGEEKGTAIEQLGQQGQLNARRLNSTTARQTRRAAIAAGRGFCAASIGVLKNYYGNRWNPRWQAAGFHRNSVAVPENPVSLLMELREYFRLHPEHENEKLSVTKTGADLLLHEIAQCEHGTKASRVAQMDARRNRNGALRQLKRRLVSLRSELALNLTADDPRWLQFGFRRPAEVRAPEPVESVEIKPGLPGEVSVQWSPAVRAESYRVTKQVQGVDAAPVEIGIFADTEMMIRELPEGATVSIAVSARNRAGESVATNAVVT